MQFPSDDLSSVSVFLDFDGTISTDDIGNHLVGRLARPGWEWAEDAYRKGEIGSMECIRVEWAHLPVDGDLLRAVAAEVPLDPGFEPLITALRGAGAEVTVVSDGFGFHVRTDCEPLGIPVITNDADPDTGELSFPAADPECSTCGVCGTCKRVPILEARSRGRVTVMVGDGVSDRHAAKEADVVLATAGLLAWCHSEGIACVPFSDLGDVTAALVAGRQGK